MAKTKVPDDDLEVQDSFDVTEEDENALVEAEDDAPPVSYTGTDFDVEGLVRRLERGDIVIPTFDDSSREEVDIETERFQRGFVWRRPQMDRFIESLLLEYPIPGIILVQQIDKRYLVLDGQQRLGTLADFYRGIHREREFVLTNVAKRFQGLSYRRLSPELKRTLDSTFIQATIVKTDGSADSLDAVYQVFERLNSGGTQLTPHEIRVALYAGDFVNLLVRLNDNYAWRALYGKKSPRLRDQEIILRSIALHISANAYKRPLKTFLNRFVSNYRNLERLPAGRVVSAFEEAARLLLEGPGRSAIRWQGNNAVNTALTEALFVGLMQRLSSTEPGPTVQAVTEAVERIKSDKMLVPAITRATADEESVRTRISISVREFASA